MSKGDDKKFLHYSLAFYQKEKQLASIANRAKLGFDQLNSPSKQSALKPKTVENFLRFNSKNKAYQKQLLQQDSDSYIEALLDVIICLNREASLMEYVLTTLDAIFTEQRQVLRKVVDDLKEGKYPNLISKLKGFQVLNNKSSTVTPLMIFAAYRVVSILLGELPVEQFFNQQRIFLFELLQTKRTQKDLISDYGFVSCLVHLNKHNILASLFLDNDGGSLLLECLNRCGNDIQLIYYSLLNLWMISFLQTGVQKFIAIPKLGVIRAVCEILQKVSRQKITRVAFMIFKNIQENHTCLQLLIDNRLLKIIDTILKGNIKDEQLINSIKQIGFILQSNIRILSSFDKYVKEIKSHSLEWSSVHNERFWKQNALKFQNNDYEMIKQLKFLLGSKRVMNVAIACYDIGEFCRFYPRGKGVIEMFQIKDLIMEKARYSEDKSIREQALIALQKIMIQNWQAI